MKLVLVFALLGFSSAAFDYDKNVCTPDTLGPAVANPPKQPDFSQVKSFQSRVEANLLELNRTLEFDEYFDYDNNIGSLIEFEAPVKKEKGIFNYKTNEIIIADLWKRTCKVEDLSRSQNKFLFGQTTRDGKKHIYTVQGALRYDTTNVKQVYLGSFVVRGIRTNRWVSCLKWPDQRATIKLEWDFSDKDAWLSALGITQVPVRAHAWGTIMQADGTTKDHDFNHYYEFTQYRPAVLKDLDDVFETPKGLVCPGRKNTRPLPTPPTHFQMHSEVVQPEFHMIGYVQEFYDYASKLARYDYKPLPLNTKLDFGLNPLTEVHDFNTGVRYIMDKSLGNCSYRMLDGGAFDARNTDPQTVRIRTAKEIFDFDGANYTYSGVRTVRDITTDVWIAQRTDFPAGVTGVNSTFEWYFAQNDWLENSMMNYEFGEPVMLEITIGEPLNIHTIYNIYNFNEDQPAFWNYDISQCFTYLGRAVNEISLPGQFRGIVDVNLELFKTSVLFSIQATAVVSPLRVTNIVIDYDDDNIIVKFTLLDKAPIAGNTKLQVQEVPLNVALETLKETIDHGQFVVTMLVDTEADPVLLVANQYSLKSTVYINGANPDAQSDTSSGFSSGIIAAIAIAMAVGGFVIGILIVYGIYRRNGGTLRSLPFTSTNFDNPNYADPKA